MSSQKNQAGGPPPPMGYMNMMPGSGMGMMGGGQGISMMRAMAPRPPPMWARPPPPPPPRDEGNKGRRYDRDDRPDILDMTYDEYVDRYVTRQQ